MSAVKEILGVRHYKAGYEVREELIDGSEYGCADFTMKSAYTSDGHYIGGSKTAHRLCKQRGIKPEPRTPDSHVCSIGFSEREQKWYGWSHRAIFGFGIGSVVDSDHHLCACEGWTGDYLAEHPEESTALPVGFTAKTLDDCKRMACAFAAAVS